MNWYGDLLWFFVEHPIISFILLFVEFVVIMKIHYKAHNKYLHAVMAVFFVPQDVVANVVFTSIVGLELPQEWLVTSRMKRWKKLNPTQSRLYSWRFNFATKLCEQLNKHDAGHC